MKALVDVAKDVTSDSSDDELIDLATRFRDEGFDDVQAIALLAESLANSGTIERFGRSADVASTGGPSSLTTLLCPLFLVLAGWNVPKVTVAGRPAGGIDVLGTIAGYQTRPGVAEMRSWLSHAHYVHAEAAQRWAPLDGRLFRLRQQRGLQAVAPLVVASILAKKRALRLDRAVVEIRRGPFGNLGDEEDKLLHAARLFEVVAERMHIICKAIVTGDGAPYQGMIGRGEALLALYQVFDGSPAPALREHVDLCKFLAEQAVGVSIDADFCELRGVFASNLSVQGSSYDAFTRRVIEVRAESRVVIKSSGSGVLHWDLGSIRDAIVGLQKPRPSQDDAAGVELIVLRGEVEAEQPIAAVRGPSQLRQMIETSYTVT